MEKISGEIVKGAGIGKTLGFPTLNVNYSDSISGVRPAKAGLTAKVSTPSVCLGVFVGRVFLKNKIYKAAAHVGARITFGEKKKIAEVFLIEAGLGIGDFYDENIEIELLEKIRDTKKFPNEKVLKEQISKDVEFVKNWYNSHAL
ncbi:riboflavin kinase [Candidatus Peregrinibacteria bacterium]|nr:riboflavin kinase [Candidatus Peregrinibacteria bacterium]